MAGGLEATDISIEDAETVYVTFVTVAAEQLLTDADAKDRLGERTDDLVEAMLAQVIHGTASLALSGENYTVGGS